MKERPIIMRPHEVRAILDGRKTQFRRIVRRFRGDKRPIGSCGIRDIGNGYEWYGAGGVWMPLKCPYGVPGDLLWVREALRADGDYMVYAADVGRIDCGDRDWPSCIEQRKTISPVAMPRWASRLSLEVTESRIQRVQDITEEEARKEGVTPSWLNDRDGETVLVNSKPTHRRGFARQWNEDHGPDAWGRNDWVWVVSFKTIKENEA